MNRFLKDYMVKLESAEAAADEATAAATGADVATDPTEVQVTENDINNNVEEIQKTSELSETLGDHIILGEKQLENPENVTPPDVALAQSVAQECAKGLGLLHTIPMINNVISVESVRESAAMSLRVAIEEEKGLLAKAGDKLKQLWEWLKKQVMKLVALVKKFLPNAFSTLEKLKSQVEKKKEAIDKIGKVDKSSDDNFRNSYGGILWYFDGDTKKVISDAPDAIKLLANTSGTALGVAVDNMGNKVKDPTETLVLAYTDKFPKSKGDARVTVIGWKRDNILTIDDDTIGSTYKSENLNNNHGYFNNIIFKSDEIVTGINKLLGYKDSIMQSLESAEKFGKQIDSHNDKFIGNEYARKAVKSYSEVIKLCTSAPMEEIKIYTGFINAIISSNGAGGDTAAENTEEKPAEEAK